MGEPEAAATLAKLQEQRRRVAVRVSDLEAEWRAATAQAAEASAALAEVERHGGSATARHKAEEQLAAAKQRASEPWSERVEGARAATRDADQQLRQHVAANLDELVAGLEQEGQATADRLNDAAASLVQAHAEWQSIAGRIGQLITMVHRPGPLDVSRSVSDDAARAVAALVAGGGEEGPKLDRAREPWSRLLADPEPAGELDDLQPTAA
jgi:hypothetical protein